MNYQEIFDRMPLSLLQELERQPWAASQLREGERLDKLLGSVEAMKKLRLVLNKVEVQTLRIIMTQIGCEAFQSARLEKAAAASMSGAQAKVSLAGLRSYGIIITFRKSWGEQIHVLPEDGFHIWQSLLLEQLGSNSPPLDEGLDIEPAASDSRGFAQDVFDLLIYAYHHELPITNKGTLHKKQIQKLQERAPLPRSDVPIQSVRFAYSEIYGMKLACLLDAALRLEIINQQPTQLVINQEALDRWLRLSFEEQQSRLYQLWKRGYDPAPTWLQHSISLMDKQPTGLWCSLDRLVEWLHRQAVNLHDIQDESISETLVLEWIRPLQHFQYIELAKDAVGKHWYRWLIERKAMGSEVLITTPESIDITIYVQPDFEILLPPDAPGYVEWEIAAFAIPLSSHQVRIYKITKESFHRACEMGLSWMDWIEMLQRLAKYEMPAHVLLTLKQWGEQFGNLYFAELTLLRCQDIELANRIAQSEKSKPYLLGRLGEMDFIVDKAQVLSFRKLLEQMGTYPRHKIQMNDAAADRLIASSEQRLHSWNHREHRKDSLAKGLLVSQAPILHYELDPRLNHLGDIYPNMQDIPPLWLKEYRAYHSSTRKDLIRKAIEWQSYLKLRRAGEDRYIVPRALSENSSGWILTGTEAMQEVVLGMEDWEEMQLILPGVNDLKEK